MKIEDNHYTYRIETKDSNGGSLDFIDIDTVELLRCAYDVQDELNLETNEHIKRVEEIVLDANSTEFWYVDEVRTSDTHLVCYFEEVELMASKDHPMVDTDRSVFEYGKINSNEHQNTNFICTHVMDNGVSRLYMSIDKETFGFATFNNETIKHFISNNPVTVWYALRYEIIIPRSMSKGHLLTLGGQTDITLTTTSEQAKLPIMKFNVGDTQYTLDTNPIHINNTQEGTQIRNIVLEGNTPINYARGNGVNTTEQESNTRYDFEPFYDGQATIQGTVEGGYVSAKLYGDTMVNIAKPYGETPLLTATNTSTLCDDLLGMNEEGIVLADGEITEGRIVGNSIKGNPAPMFTIGGLKDDGDISDDVNTCHSEVCLAPNRAFTFITGYQYTKVVYYDADMVFVSCDKNDTTTNPVSSTPPSNAVYVRYGTLGNGTNASGFTWTYNDNREPVYSDGIQSVVNPCTIFLNNNFTDKNLFNKDTVTVNYVLNTSTGEPSIANSGYSISDFIFVAKGCNYRVANDNCFGMCFYDLNKNFISSISRSFTPTQNGYIRFVYGNDNINIVMFGSFSSTNPTYTEYQQLDMQQATFPYTLNKLPNGVADYIDVVNKVHVQRVGKVVFDGSENWSCPNNLQKDETVVAVLYGQAYGRIYNDGTNASTGLCDKLDMGMGTTTKTNIYNPDGTWVLSVLKTELSSSTLEGVKQWLSQKQPTVLGQLKTPIYTPLTDEEIAQLPLSAYKDGYVNLSSDQLTPSFEFRMRASNRYQVDMLETGYYYLNAPTGNVKLGTANVDIQQMPCIVKVDNVGTGDSGYRLGFENNLYVLDISLKYEEGRLSTGNGNIVQGHDGRWTSDFINVPYYNKNIYIANDCVLIDVVFYDKNKNYLFGKAIGDVSNIGVCFIPNDTNIKYMRISGKNNKMIVKLREQPITLAKLPSHRIPTSFTQGMKCGTDFGYWEGVKVATGKGLYVSATNKLDFAPIELNRIEYNNTIVEDEFDIATGKLTKRIGKYTINGNSNIWGYNTNVYDTSTHMSFGCSQIPNFKKGGRCIGFLGLKIGLPNSTDSSENWNNLGVSDYFYFRFRKDRYSQYGTGADGVRAYFNANPTTIYYELEIPEISYVNLSSNQVKTVANSTLLQSWRANTTYLNPQIKPSHLIYPVPSLVGNRTYTVVHNRKNITGSTKPIELNLGGTVVQLNDASSKTLVKTPSTLAHSNLIFIGGESTVDHIMVLDGDWTNKPIEYFENMKGHDTDAIITIIGDGKIDDVAEQYLW